MSSFDNAPLNVKATLFATTIRLNAVVKSLNPDQSDKYEQVLAEEREKALVHLKDLLTTEELDEFINLLT